MTRTPDAGAPVARVTVDVLDDRKEHNRQQIAAWRAGSPRRSPFPACCSPSWCWRSPRTRCSRCSPSSSGTPPPPATCTRPAGASGARCSRPRRRAGRRLRAGPPAQPHRGALRRARAEQTRPVRAARRHPQRVHRGDRRARRQAVRARARRRAARALSRIELEGVLAQQLSHVRDGDTALPRSSRRSPRCPARLHRGLARPVRASTPRRAAGRPRRRRLTRYPPGLADALSRLEGHDTVVPA